MSVSLPRLEYWELTCTIRVYEDLGEGKIAGRVVLTM